MNLYTNSQNLSSFNNIIEWVQSIIGPLSNIEKIVQTPWSVVLKVETQTQSFYLKQTPELIALEADVIQTLSQSFNASVPKIIAQNKSLHCFLMTDEGLSLRSVLKRNFNSAILCKAIEQFTALQIEVSKNADALINIGVPDWRLNRLPYLFQEILLQKDWFHSDGVLGSDLNTLMNLMPKVEVLCLELSNFEIKQSFVQPDFNDNNTLINQKTQKLTIIDLGEIAIAHPFFSLFNCLEQVIKHYNLTEEDSEYSKIKEACLKNYIKISSQKQVLNAFEIAKPLWWVYSLLAQYRFMQACGAQNIIAFQKGKLKKSILLLIESLKSV